METPQVPSPKVVDVLLENLKNALSIIDRAFLLALLAAGFVLVHGLQGDIERDFREKLEHAAKAKSPASQIQEGEDTQDHQIDVPLLGFKAELSAAIGVAIVCYWIFSVRAALYVWRIRPIIVWLGTDAEVIRAALLRPSLATAGRGVRLCACLVLGVFGWVSYLLSQLPYNAVIGRSLSELVIMSAILMFPTAVALFVVTEFTSKLIERVTPQFTVNHQRFDPYKNFKFRLKWGGKFFAGFSKCGALKRTTEVVNHREGGHPSSTRKSPGRTKYDPITLERGVTHDAEFEKWASKVWNYGSEDFRRDIVLEVYHEAGQLIAAYKVYRCWVSEFQGQADLDANANAILIEHIKLENEGCERDYEVAEPTEPNLEPGT